FRHVHAKAASLDVTVLHTLDLRERAARFAEFAHRCAEPISPRERRRPVLIIVPHERLASAPRDRPATGRRDDRDPCRRPRADGLGKCRLGPSATTTASTRTACRAGSPARGRGPGRTMARLETGRTSPVKLPPVPILADHVARYFQALRPPRSEVMRAMEELAEREGIPIVHWETGRF